MFDEEHKYKLIEQYSQTLFDCKTQKIKAFVKEKPLYNHYNFDPVVLAWNVDPLTHKYPGQTPYTFASNSPIAGIDANGLEFYFAADGTFLGKYGNSGEIRIANIGAEQVIVNLLNTYKDHPQVGISQDELDKINTTKMLFTHDITTASLGEASKVYTTIYKREINGGANNIKAVRTNPSEGGSHLEGKIEINLNNRYYNEALNSDYYNVASTLTHEDAHFRGIATHGSYKEYFEHFDIQRNLLNTNVYKNSTSLYKVFVKATMHDYIGQQETYLFTQIKNIKRGSNIDKNIVNNLISQYKNNVDFYNKTFNENKETINFEITN